MWEKYRGALKASHSTPAGILPAGQRKKAVARVAALIRRAFAAVQSGIEELRAGGAAIVTGEVNDQRVVLDAHSFSFPSSVPKFVSMFSNMPKNFAVSSLTPGLPMYCW